MYELHVAGITNRHDGLLMFPVLSLVMLTPPLAMHIVFAHFDIESVSEMYARIHRLIICNVVQKNVVYISVNMHNM